MTKKQTLIVIALAVFVIVGLIISIMRRDTAKPQEGAVPSVPESSSPASSGKSGVSSYSPSVPQSVKLSIPVSEAPAAAGAEEKFRKFVVQVSSSGYDPAIITVNEGDIIQISLTATDGDYDFSMPYTGLYQMVSRGETKSIGFGATTPGTFTFACKNHCPSTGKIQGSIIVLPR